MIILVPDVGDSMVTAAPSGDVTYNSRRGMLGAICVERKIAYHLYNVTTGKTGNIVKLIRKSRWHAQYAEPPDPDEVESITELNSITDSFS